MLCALRTLSGYSKNVRRMTDRDCHILRSCHLHDELQQLLDLAHLVIVHGAGCTVHQVHPGGAPLPQDTDTGQQILLEYYYYCYYYYKQKLLGSEKRALGHFAVNMRFFSRQPDSPAVL